mmetsp:Transcript_18831/g.34010  ORF Transcript_18831/g.34010 Transcript_18831/m.34010 type:complete len:127 (+) Transcript_18831:38-418(+)
MVASGPFSLHPPQQKDSPLLHQGKETVTQFGLDVFQRADNEDRAELADKGTAKVFYVAANFFDTLKQFGDIGRQRDFDCTHGHAKALATHAITPTRCWKSRKSKRRRRMQSGRRQRSSNALKRAGQ